MQPEQHEVHKQRRHLECHEVMARDQGHSRARIGITHCCRLSGGKLIKISLCYSMF